MVPGEYHLTVLGVGHRGGELVVLVAERGAQGVGAFAGVLVGEQTTGGNDVGAALILTHGVRSRNPEEIGVDAVHRKLHYTLPPS